MSSASRGDTTDLHNVYSDLATALGSAHQQATLEGGSPDRLATVNHAVQQLWSLTVQRLGAGLDRADLSDIPPMVEPDLDAPADLDVDAILDHVATFDTVTAAPPQQPRKRFGFSGSVRTAALVWCAVASVLAVLLGVIAGPVVVLAFILPVATTLLVAWRGIGRARGALWAIGLTPLVFLVAGTYTELAFVALVEGFAYLAYLSSIADGSWQHDPRAQRRPLEIELVLYSLAAWTTGIDMVGLLFVACLAGLLWRRRWTAATAAAVTGLALFIELSAWSIASLFLADGLIYAVLTVHWVRAIFHSPWLAGRLSMTEAGLTLSGWALRGGWRVAQRTVEKTLPPLAPPHRGGLFQDTRRGDESDGFRYCWTCHQKTKHESAGFSLPICRRCVSRAGGGGHGSTFREPCSACGGPTPHTHDGKCLSCWRKGR